MYSCHKTLSIMAPCYNGESYIKRFLDSILNQTFPQIELIVINDGSVDSTEEVLVSYEERFKEKKYRYIHIYQDNQGIGAALNNALKLVTGDYLTWFGTDDIVMPTYAEELVGFLEENNEFAVVRSEGYWVDKNDTTIIKGLYSRGNNDKHNPFLFENAIMEKNFHFGYSVIRMSEFDKVNPQREIYPSRQGQNWQLLLPVFYDNKAAFFDKPLYYVIDDSNSVSMAPHKSYEKLKKQNLEYEAILVNVLNSMDIVDRDKYLDMVKLKYIRRRMCAALSFEKYADAINEYKSLKALKQVKFSDWLRYLHARFPSLYSFLKK